MASTSRLEPVASIIVPVFNHWELTSGCLEALAKTTARVPHEIIVVDNASSDATPRELVRWRTPIRTLRNEANRGFAVACNQGASVARAPNLVFLNNDTTPVDGWLEPLVEEVRKHHDVWAVGSRLLYGDGSIQHAGVSFARETRNPFHPYRGLRADDPRVGARRELQAVTAACVLIRAERFEACGRFDEQYRNGYEDLDLCLTIRARGGKVVYQPWSVVVHLESRTPGRMLRDAENREIFFRRWCDAILSDEDDFYFADGLRRIRVRGEKEAIHLVRLESEEETARWAVVAGLERDAAAGRHEGVVLALESADAWPDDADVRAWAGALCLRFGLAEPARRHLTVARALGAGAEVRLHLALEGADVSGPSATREVWEVDLLSGLGHLREARWSPAQRALESALRDGAPPDLVLPGLFEAARQLGEAKEAEAIRAALLELPRVDPVTDLGIRPPTSAPPERGPGA